MVSDPPNQTTTLTLFETRSAAQTDLDTLKARGRGEHCYLVPPASERKR
jgi:hypothetical protein